MLKYYNLLIDILSLLQSRFALFSVWSWDMEWIVYESSPLQYTLHSNPPEKVVILWHNHRIHSQ